METPQRQNNFVRSREAPMDFQYDEGNPFYVTTSIFGNTPIPTIPQQTESDVDDTAGIAGQKRTLFSLLVRFTGYTAWWHRPFSLFHSPPSRSLKPPGTLSSTSNSAPSTPFSNLVLFSTSFSPSSPFGATIVNKNNGNNNVTTKVDSTPKTPVMGGKFLFSPPNSDIFNSPSTSTLAGRAGAREFRQLKKRRAETAWTQRSRSRSSSRSRSRSRTRSTMDGRLSRIGGRDFGESDVSDSEGRSNNTRYKDANTSMYEDTGTDPQDYYSSPLPPTSQQSMMNRDMPYILSGYTQLLCNILLLGVGFYYVLQFVLTVQRDVDLKVEEYSSEIIQEIAQCNKNYMDNRCAPGSRVPAMDTECRLWEKCMHRDPSVVGRAKVSAETFAEIINSFIEPISYKTMSVILGIVFGSVLVSNLAFSFLRWRYQPQLSAGFHPATPMHGYGVSWQSAPGTPMAGLHNQGTPMGTPMGQPPGMHMSMSMPSTPMGPPKTPMKSPMKGYGGGMPVTPRSPRNNGRGYGN